MVKKNGDFNLISPFGKQRLLAYFNTRLYLSSEIIKAPFLVPIGGYYDHSVYANTPAGGQANIARHVNYLKCVFINIKNTDDENIRYHFFSESPIDLSGRNYAQLIYFAKRIEDENQDLLQRCHEYCLNVRSFPGFWEKFNTPFPISISQIQLQKASQFLQESGVINASLSILSQNEIRCLFYLEQGLNAHKIAQKINTSARNIYYFIVSIKEKLGLYSRKELIDLAQMIHPFLIDIEVPYWSTH